jgi:hypothetical protein
MMRWGDRLARTKAAHEDQKLHVLGLEQKLWQAADKLRSNLDAAE